MTEELELPLESLTWQPFGLLHVAWRPFGLHHVA